MGKCVNVFVFLINIESLFAQRMNQLRESLSNIVKRTDGGQRSYSNKKMLQIFLFDAPEQAEKLLSHFALLLIILR